MASELNQTKPHILIVEDDEGLIQLLCDIFRDNYRVSSAQHGLAALKILNSHAIDLIVSDISMPKLDGIGLLKSLRENEKFKHIPVIVLTAFTDSSAHLQSLELGARDVITKPFNIDHIALKVRNLLNGLNSSSVESPAKSDSEHQPKHNRNHRFIKKYEHILSCRFDNSEFTIGCLAKQMNMSERQLQRRVKMIYNTSPAAHLRHFRLIKGRQLLIQGFSITYTYQAIGFTSQSHFSRAYKSLFGTTPKQVTSVLKNG